MGMSAIIYNQRGQAQDLHPMYKTDMMARGDA